MTFQESFKTCLTEKYAKFEGRASRSEYWWFFLAYILIVIIATLLGWIVQLVAIVALIVPMTAVGWRRLQDTGKPGWYILIPVGLSLLFSLTAPTMPAMGPDGMPVGGMPSTGGMVLGGLLGIVQLVVGLLFLWWLTRPSDPETNAYGPPPAT